MLLIQTIQIFIGGGLNKTTVLFIAAAVFGVGTTGASSIIIGLAFGYLYRKYNIGYAMISHGLCHLIADTLMIIFV